MARARNIKPAFFSNEELAEFPFEARLLFIGLWTLADREGRLEDRPKRIKMALFPADNIDAEQLLNSLQTVGLLKRYVCDGFSVIQITNFVKHQAPHGLEKDSELPDEDGFYCHHPRNQSGLVSGKNKPEFYTKQQLTEKNNSFQTVKEPFKSSYLPCHNRLNPDSLNPDSLNPESNTEEEKKVEKKESPQATGAAPPDGGVAGLQNKKPEKPKSEESEAGFEKFWQVWPKSDRKQAKGLCLKAWKKAGAERHAADILAHIEACKRSENWSKEGGQFIPAPLVYLNQKRWEGAELAESVAAGESKFGSGFEGVM